ncbi:hypothetical protein cypCar_00045034 [Cyprinus carpio]|nr:hypothetical protein cypCar_00045034 [Cyprinus carpio]
MQYYSQKSSQDLGHIHSQEFRFIFFFSFLIVSVICPHICPEVIVIIVEFAVFAAPTVILLQIFCERRAGEVLR